MAVKITKVDVWAGDITDQPGGLDSVLGRLADAGANLECVIARRQPEKPGTGVVFVTPIKGKKAQAAAMEAGLKSTGNITTLRVEGADKPGVGNQITSALAAVGINLRGITAAVIGGKFISYLALDSAEDASRASKALKSVNGKSNGRRR
jgi:hypothetical protein